MKHLNQSRDFIIESAKTIVIKVGSSLLTENSQIEYKNIKKYAKLIYQLKQRKKNVILVTSGAVASSGYKLSKESNAIQTKQVLSSIGQVHLMAMYSKAFKGFKLKIGQVLLSEFSISNRTSYLNAKATIHSMLNLGVVPIINENDTVATEELKLGDNDMLGALVCGLVDSDLYLILSDIDGFYTNYKKDNEVFHSLIERVQRKHLLEARGSTSGVGTGGMYTKLLAAKKCGELGVPCVITNGRERDLFRSIFKLNKGTLFVSQSTKPKSKKKWIASQLDTKNSLVIDKGAKKALLETRASLLPKGITRVQGHFGIGSICNLIDESNQIIAKGIVNFDSDQLNKIIGKNTAFIKKLLGEPLKQEVVHANNLFLIEN